MAVFARGSEAEQDDDERDEGNARRRAERIDVGFERLAEQTEAAHGEAGRDATQHGQRRRPPP